MEPVNQSDEALRLRDFYSRMSEGELLELAETADDLTEVAQSALRAELSRRGLEAPAALSEESSAAPARPSDEELVEVWRTQDPAEAASVQQILEAAAILSYLTPESEPRIEMPGAAPADGAGIIRVSDADAPRALSVLHSAGFGQAQGDEEFSVVCPKCHSSETVFEGLDEEPADGSEGGALFNWSCEACGHQWKDDGVARENPGPNPPPSD